MKQLLISALVCLLLASCGENDGPSKKNQRFPNQTCMEHSSDWMADIDNCEIRDGKFWQDGKWRFLKIGKPLANYASESGCSLIESYLPKYKELGYDVLELNCYWHHFETDGDGVIDKSLEPLKQLVAAIYAAGMFPCLTVETYSVGGGQMPKKFFEKYPEAVAINSNGKEVRDEEYGFNTAVVSIFHEAYRENVHKYIENLCRGLGDELKHILWFETTVEPQYTGDENNKICYSENARRQYALWREANGITDPSSEMPETFPMPDDFVKNGTWNKFRAQFLAKWVNEDAQVFKKVYKEITGKEGYVAADFLCASYGVQYLRDGNPQEFLNNLTVPDIIQVNWHWSLTDNAPNNRAYEYVRNAMAVNGRTDWVIAEHMTFNGNSFSGMSYSKILSNTLEQGTRFGWEFTNVTPTSTGDTFSLYNLNEETGVWTARFPLSLLEQNWELWLEKIWAAEVGEEQ